jgi:hypothetical protein
VFAAPLNSPQEGAAIAGRSGFRPNWDFMDSGSI